MHDFNVKMAKIIILTMALAVMIIMISGMKLLAGSYYWRSKYFIMQWDYFRTELAFLEYNYGGVLNLIKNKSDNQGNLKNVSQESAKSIPILLYHGVIKDPNWKQDDVSIRFNDFRDQMFALKKAGYQTISIEDYMAFENGEKNLPQKSFMLTFDDGRKDSYYPVDPILKVVGFKAIMHVITGRSLGPGNEKEPFHLSKMELSKMIESGRWEIESHGKNDHDLGVIDSIGTAGDFLSNKLWLKDENRIETDEEYKKRITDDLLGAKSDIKKNLGVSALAFAFPFGDYGQDTKNLPQSVETLESIASSIYPITFSQAGSSQFPVNYAEKNSSPARRISVSSAVSTEELLRILKDNTEKPVDYADDFVQNKGWFPGWGLIDVKNNQMTIGATESEDSAMTFLGGSYLWENYYLEADVKVLNGNAFTLTGRYIDGDNYVACDYYDNRVVLSQKVNKEDKPEIESNLTTLLNTGKEIKVGIYVNGKNATCYLNDGKIISGPIYNDINHGGISFKVWNTTQQNAQLIIKNLKVSEHP